MSDRIVSAEDAQTRLKDLLDIVREGHEVLIADDDKVFARIAPAGAPADGKPRRKRILGLARGAVRMAPDFDDPLPDSFWEGES